MRRWARRAGGSVRLNGEKIVLIKRAATLQETLALRKLPANGTAWHHLLLQGLPYASLRSVAKALRMKEPDMATYLGLKGPQLAARKKARRLQLAESDVLYAIAIAFVKLASFKSVEEARDWLLTENESLKNARPLDLLRTRLGTEYVNTAINRMRPAPTFDKKVEEDPADEDEDELG